MVAGIAKQSHAEKGLYYLQVFFLCKSKQFCLFMELNNSSASAYFYKLCAASVSFFIELNLFCDFS